MAELGSLFVSVGSKFNAEGINSATNKIDELSKRTENITKGFKIAGAALTAFAVGGVAVITNLVKAFAEQERAEVELAAAMKQAGTYTKEAMEHNIKYASSLQSMTTYGDEAIMSVQKMLTNFGIEGPLLDKLTKATLDLAAAKGMDLKAAGDLVSKSVGSSTNALTRYGIEVTGAVGSTERMQMAVDNISRLFGGAAKAQAETFAGKIKQLENRFGDLKEKLGLTLMPVINKLTDIIANVVSWFEGLSLTTLKWIGGLLLLTTAVAGILGPLMLLIGFLPQIVAGFILVQAVISPTTLVIAGIIAAITALGFAWANNWGGIQEKTKITITAIIEFIKFLWETIKSYFGLLADTFLALGKIIAQPFQAKKHFEEWKTNVGSAVENVKNAYTKGMDAIKLKSTELKNAKIKDVKDGGDEEVKLTAEQQGRKLALAKTEADRILAETKERDRKAKEEAKKVAEEMHAIWLEANAKRIAMIKDVQATFSSSFQTMFVDILTTTKSGTDLLKEFFGSMAKAFISAVATMAAKWLAFQLLTGIFGGGFLKLAGIKAFAGGVQNFGGGLAMVGEAGPELVSLPRGSNVHNNSETKNIMQRMSSKNIALTVNVTGNNISNKMDVNSIAERVSDVILSKVKNERNI